MKTKIYLLFVILLPLLTSCLEISNNLSFSGKLTNSITLSSMNRAAVSPNGKYLLGLTATDEIYKCSNISQWDISTGQQIKTYLPDNYFREDFWHFTSLAVSPDGKYVAGSGVYIDYGRIHYLILWDIETGKEIFSINPDLTYSAMKFTPDGKKLYLMKGNNRFDIIEFLSPTMKLYKEDSLLYLNDDYHGRNRFYFSKDGNNIYFDSPSFINLSKKPPVNNYFMGQYGALFPDGTKMLVMRNNEVNIYSTKDLSLISTFIDDYVDDNEITVFSPNGKYFVTSYQYTPDGYHIEYGLQVWSAKDAKIISRIKDINAPDDIIFIDDNHFIALSFGNAYVYNISE